MSETTGTPALNEALAKFQAALPHVGKGGKADVPGKDGKRGYSYKYADLADVSQAALPLLGKFGLAFTAKPTYHLLGERLEFVLHYKLTHSSGQFDEGFYLLPDPARTDPQKVGSAITYARRYSLLAVTGIHPDGEDDDGATAQGASYSAGDAWENAAPAAPRQRPAGGRAAGNGASRQEQPPEPPRQQMAPRPPLDPEDSWAAKVEELASAEEARAAEAELKDAYDKGHVDTDRANNILYAIRQKFPLDDAPAAAAPEPPAPARQATAPPAPQRTQAQAKQDNDAGWIRQWKDALRAEAPDMDRLRNSIGQGIAQRHITAETGTVLRQEWTARNRELTEMAGASA